MFPNTLPKSSAFLLATLSISLLQITPALAGDQSNCFWKHQACQKQQACQQGKFCLQDKNWQQCQQKQSFWEEKQKQCQQMQKQCQEKQSLLDQNKQDFFNKDQSQKQAGAWGQAPGLYPMQGGRQLRVDSDGIKYFSLPDGSERTIRPDGTGIFKNADGSSIEKTADGRKIFRGADGQEKVPEPTCSK